MENKQLHKENDHLIDRITKIEMTQLENNVIISGQPEQPWETYDLMKQHVIDTIASTMGSSSDNVTRQEASKIEISSCGRVGRYKVGKSRPITVTFHKNKDKQNLLSNKRNLPTGLHINEEYPLHIMHPRSFKVAIDKEYHSKEQNLEVSVPQGSCAGAGPFNLYCAPLDDVVLKDLQLSGFADDHSIRKAFKAGDTQSEKCTKDTMETCMLKIKHWMDTMHLKMNPSKTEFIYFGNRVQLKKCLVDDLNIAGDLVLRSHTIKYLGAHPR